MNPNTSIGLLALIPTPMGLDNSKFGFPHVHAPPPNIVLTPATASPSKLKFFRDSLPLKDVTRQSDPEGGQVIIHARAPQPYPGTRYLTGRVDYNIGDSRSYSTTIDVGPHSGTVFDGDKESEDSPIRKDTISTMQSVTEHAPDHYSTQSDDASVSTISSKSDFDFFEGTPRAQPVQPVPRYLLHPNDWKSGDGADEASQGTPSSVVLSSLASRIEANKNINMSTWDRSRARSCFAAQRPDTGTRSQTPGAYRARSVAGNEMRAKSTPPSRPNVI